MDRPSITWRFDVEWGDCDEAGLVFYPHYFRWFDAGYHRMLRAAGMDQRYLRSAFNALGTPLVDARARFLGPATHGDSLDAEAAIERWGGSSFELRYAFAKAGQPVVEGVEVRVMVRRDEGIGRLSTLTLPDDFKARLSTLSRANEDGSP